METLKIELFPEVDIFLGLFINITNASSLKSEVKELQCSFLNPSLVSGLDHILLAVCRALQAQKIGPVKTNNLYLDVVYYLSGSSNIRDALVKFGISDDSKSTFLLTFSPEAFEEVRNRISGELVSLSSHISLADIRKIESEFKIPPGSNNLLPIILSRIAIKDI